MKSSSHPATSAASASPLQDNWRDLLSGRHLATVLVMASGILLYAMNLYFTAALMPSIVSDIGGQQYYAWVTTAFVIAAIIASLFVSQILCWNGPATAYLIAFLAFAFGATANAVSPTIETLIAGRIIQGFGGGLLAGLGYAVIRTALPERHWARATGVVSAMWGVGTLFGPALGGIFAELGLWRWAYAALSLLSLVFAIVAQRTFAGIAATRLRTSVPLASLLALVLAIVAISLSTITPMGWPMVTTIGTGLVLLGLFLAIERRAIDTILPRITYRKGNVLKWVYLTVATMSAGVMVENFIPLFGQKLAGLGPLTAGLLGAVLSLAWVVAQLLVVSVSSPSAKRRAVRLGPLLLTAGLVCFGLLQVENATTGIVALWALSLAVAGVGIGLAWPLLGVAAMSSTNDPAEGGKAAAAITTTQLIAFSITSALAGALMATGGESIVATARNVSIGIAILTLPGLLAAGIATRK
jgi:MFS family permease